MLSDQLAASGSGQTDRRYLRVAQELLGEISDGHYLVGARLPSDREIALRGGVSRATAREALLVLQLIGVVEASVGAGVYVASATPLLDRHDSILAAPAELIETRIWVEPAVVRLCAERMTRTEVDDLYALLREADHAAESNRPFPEFSDLSLAFHGALAANCRNRVLGSIARQLVEVTEHPLWVLLNQSVLRTVEDRKAQVAHHQAIVDAIAIHDPKAAGDAMKVHLAELEALIVPRAAVSPGLHPVHPTPSRRPVDRTEVSRPSKGRKT